MNKSTVKQISRFLGGAAVLGLLIYFVNIRPAVANYTLQLGFRQIDAGNQYNTLYTQTKNEQYKKLAQDNFEQGVNLMQKAIDGDVFQRTEFRGALAENVIAFYNSESLPEYKAGEYLNKVLQELEKSILENPRDVQVYSYTMAAYNIAARYNLNFLDRAIELGDAAIQLSPHHQQIFFEIAKAKISQRKYDEAVSDFQKAIDLNPAMLESHWNLAIAYIRMGEIEKAKEQIHIMEDLGYDIDQPAQIEKWINMYEKVGDYDKIAELQNELVKLFDVIIEKKPTVANYFSAAKANQQIGNIEKARLYAQTAAEKDSSLQQEVSSFLDNL